jgi:hypothetical protein
MSKLLAEKLAAKRAIAVAEHETECAIVASNVAVEASEVMADFVKAVVKKYPRAKDVTFFFSPNSLVTYVEETNVTPQVIDDVVSILTQDYGFTVVEDRTNKTLKLVW